MQCSFTCAKARALQSGTILQTFWYPVFSALKLALSKRNHLLVLVNLEIIAENISLLVKG